ncbi:hypothetical protein TREMEDRAFT_65846 [Tremella mesenterica DSM 1558]|uniref:uncharacterized protein n=1 Tax=Tremella mesenterica (strain ATCC 24925 / CBS 8224 / DSM 1558 / NBRC 9311 / NRRL Y-6157 / RJB 2259-6 / UBC 559-6) TaxID=578456 RepID=UPI00032D5DA3|nr:uncharacterized protein TREMEDRAFT_65846 [Tremella mesenterica DSM 1558]EIW66235.1 hypothetical protein TREMEDRAFT_65846 [Tremella mesenterica DSM 1558]
MTMQQKEQNALREELATNKADRQNQQLLTSKGASSIEIEENKPCLEPKLTNNKQIGRTRCADPPTFSGEQGELDNFLAAWSLKLCQPGSMEVVEVGPYPEHLSTQRLQIPFQSIDPHPHYLYHQTLHGVRLLLVVQPPDLAEWWQAHLEDVLQALVPWYAWSVELPAVGCWCLEVVVGVEVPVGGGVCDGEVSAAGGADEDRCRDGVGVRGEVVPILKRMAGGFPSVEVLKARSVSSRELEAVVVLVGVLIGGGGEGHRGTEGPIVQLLQKLFPDIPMESEGWILNQNSVMWVILVSNDQSGECIHDVKDTAHPGTEDKGQGDKD